MITVVFPNGTKHLYGDRVTAGKVIEDVMLSGILRTGDKFYLLGVDYGDIYVKQHQLQELLPEDMTLDLVILRNGKTPYLDRNS